MRKIIRTASDWFLLSRVPFIPAGILPFILGTIMAYRLTGMFSLPVFSLGFFGVVLVLLATHYNGEVHDIVEDKLSSEAGITPFAGGSQVLVKGKIGAGHVEAAARAAAFIALAIGIILQFFYRTGPWTLPLGISGIIFGYYYSKPPLRWVKRGIGEVLIAYSYGWLPVAAGFYIQAQRFNSLCLWVSLPVAWTVFNLILINEFLDYPADMKAGKTNLLVRIGIERGAFVYVLASAAAVAAFFYSLYQGAPYAAAVLYVLAAGVTVAACSMVIAGKYKFRGSLQIICAFSIIINFLTTLSYIAGFLWR